MKTVEQIVEQIHHGTVQVLPVDEFKKKLQSGKKLNIKLGMDPTAPDLHLGHAVVLSKLKEFQDLGHNVIFLIGDFTARIGDPTGRLKTRPPLTSEDIAHNMKSYFDQVGKILDINKVDVRYNSEWLGNLSCADMVQLCGKVTLARITEREDFAKRIREKESVGFHELLYPIFQGYDSVVLHADVELGGTDQTFNLLMGRFLQEQYSQEPQIIITVPLLVGLDGVQKMSKSLGNAVGIAEPADEAFGKLMSMADLTMWPYFTLLLGMTQTELSALQEKVAYGTVHPMALKKQMAYDIIAKFWSKDEADQARAKFEALFQKKDYSQAEQVAFPADFPNPVWVVDLLKYLDAVKGSSEAKRLLESHAVLIDANPINDFKAQIAWKSGMIIKVGKHRIYKIY
jgi:tyrosyl-tRNA synthetase